MAVERYDAADLLLLALFELAGFAVATQLLQLASGLEGSWILSLIAWTVILGHASVLLGHTWYPALLRLLTTLAFPFSVAGLLAMPGLGVTLRTLALSVFVGVVMTYWISGRLYDLGYEADIERRFQGI